MSFQGIAPLGERGWELAEASGMMKIGGMHSLKYIDFYAWREAYRNHPHAALAGEASRTCYQKTAPGLGVTLSPEFCPSFLENRVGHSEGERGMKLIEPFSIYHCTRCNTVHATLNADRTIYEEHLGHADMHGIVKRYVLNEKLGDWIAGLTALYSVAFWIFIGIQAFTHWPFGMGWKLPPIFVWAFVIAALLFMFTVDGIVTFGRSPWGTEQGSRTTRFLRELRSLQGSIAYWIIMIASVAMFDGLRSGDVFTCAASFTAIEVAFLLMFYAPVSSDGFCFRRPHNWLMLGFCYWFMQMLGLHYLSPHFAWDIAASRTFFIWVALLTIPLVIIGFIAALRFIALRLVVQLVRLWRSAERIADEQGRKN